MTRLDSNGLQTDAKLLVNLKITFVFSNIYSWEIKKKN